MEWYIQLLVNLGHKFTYIKSVVLQAITKYLHMVSPDSLPKHHRRYSPLHREKSFKSEERKLIRYATGCTWYTDEDHMDVEKPMEKLDPEKSRCSY